MSLKSLFLFSEAFCAVVTMRNDNFPARSPVLSGFPMTLPTVRNIEKLKTCRFLENDSDFTAPF